MIDSLGTEFLLCTHNPFFIFILTLIALLDCSKGNVVYIKKVIDENTYVIHSYSDKILFKTTRYSNGLLNGETVEYFTNSNVALIDHYVDGKLNGLSYTFHDNGIMFSKNYYSNDLMEGNQYVYYTNNKLQLFMNYSNGERNGFWTNYGLSGSIENVIYHQNDVLRSRKTFRGNRRFDEFHYPESNVVVIKEYKDSILECIVMKSNDKYFGYFTRYHPNGNLEGKARLKDEKMIYIDLFDENGKFIRRVTNISKNDQIGEQ